MNYAKAKQKCTANHDVFMQCPYCGWCRPYKPTCNHRFSIVVEWKNDTYFHDMSKMPYAASSKATKLACEECGEVKSL